MNRVTQITGVLFIIILGGFGVLMTHGLFLDLAVILLTAVVAILFLIWTERGQA